MVLHVAFRDHQSQATCWVERYNDRQPECCDGPVSSLTNTRVPLPRDRRRQRREPKRRSNQDRAERRTEDLALPWIQTDAKGQEDQSEGEKILHCKKLTG